LKEAIKARGYRPVAFNPEDSTTNARGNDAHASAAAMPVNVDQGENKFTAKISYTPVYGGRNGNAKNVFSVTLDGNGQSKPVHEYESLNYARGECCW
jgi:hypothetical protein